MAVCLSASLSQARAVSPTTVQPPYHLMQKFPLGGTQRWDYLTLDSSTRHLYITRATQVVVLNVDTGTIVGKIAGTPGVHGVALAPELGRGFTSNGAAGTATIFDLKTLKVLGEVKTGNDPDAIVYDSFSQKVFTFNGKSNDATVFDAHNGKVLGTLPLGGTPEFAVTNKAGQVYVNIEDTNEVLTLDVKQLTISKRVALKPCQQPTGIASDRQHHRLFIGCRNQMMAVVDADSGQIKATLPIGKRVDATAFDPVTGLAFSSNGEGTLTVIHEDSPDKFMVVGTVVTQPGARTMALDERSHRVFLAAAKFESSPSPESRPPTRRPNVVPDSFVILVFGLH